MAGVLVNDDVLFIFVFACAAFFSTMSFQPLPRSFEEDAAALGFDIGMIPAIIRVIIFPFFAGIFWALLAIYSVLLGNCSAAFGTCYTSPNYLATTATTNGNFMGLGLGLAFGALSAVFIIVFFVITISMYGKIMVMTGRRPSPLP